MPELRVEGGSNGGTRACALEHFEAVQGVGGDSLTVRFSGCVPGFPIEAEELVEQAEPSESAVREENQTTEPPQTFVLPTVIVTK